MTDHRTAGELVAGELIMLASAGLVGHLAHALASLPGWVGGIIGGTVVGVALRLLGPTLDTYGQRLRERLTPAPRRPPAALEHDDPDATG